MHDVISGRHNCYKGKENRVWAKEWCQVGGYLIPGGKKSLYENLRIETWMKWISHARSAVRNKEPNSLKVGTSMECPNDSRMLVWMEEMRQSEKQVMTRAHTANPLLASLPG